MEETASSEKVAKSTESTNPFDEPTGKNPFEEDEEESRNQAASAEVQPTLSELHTVSPFHGLISRCFENHLNIFVDSQDKYSKCKITPVFWLKCAFRLKKYG